jgi:hypothetical protein
MTDMEVMLRYAHDHGAVLKIDGERVTVLAPTPLPPDLMEKLRRHKSELRAYMQYRQETLSSSLPFPLGCGGFPTAQVEAAEAINDKFGITDPLHRRYNVLAWVQGYYQDRRENRGNFYEAIKQEQQRLGRILDQKFRR